MYFCFVRRLQPIAEHYMIHTRTDQNHTVKKRSRMRLFQSSPAAKQRLEVESLLLSSQEEAVEGKREKNE